MPHQRNRRHVHPSTLDELITGDEVVTRLRWWHRRYLGVVVTHGARFVNVIDRRGVHHAYSLSEIDRRIA